jgi:RNA polymerase sigma-70 factor (ECF subfamily)
MPPSPKSDEARDDLAGDYALMAGIRSRDESALSALYDRYSPLVYAHCLRVLGDPGEAEDLLIDIFWELWDRGDRYDAARGRPLAHILGLTRSRATDRLRARRSRKRIAGVASGPESQLENEAASEPPADSHSIVVEQQKRVTAAMAQLPADQRQALELAFYDAMSHSEVAAKLGQPLGTVKSRIRQALISLRGLLGRNE